MTREPLPPLYIAKQNWNIDFKKPVFVKNGFCNFCGKEITKNRKFCSDFCRNEYYRISVFSRNRNAYSIRILYRDNFTCQICGEFHAKKNKYGIFLPTDDGKLRVHHIIPVSEGGDDSPENLTTLCNDCHKKIHKRKR